MALRLSGLILSLLLLAACAATPQTTEENPAVTELHELFEAEWQRGLRENPTYASSQGDRRYNDQWPDLGSEARERRQAADRAVLERLAEIDRSALPPEEQLNYDLFKTRYERRVAGHRFNDHYIALNQRGGIQTADEMTSRLPFERVEDYEDWITRLESFSDYMDQTIALLYEGLETGWTLPRVIAERIPDQIAAQLVEHPDESGFYDPFRQMPDRIPAAEKERLREDAVAAIRHSVLPAYERFHGFFTEEYIPGARETIGARHFPNGEAYYAWRVRDYTTTELTPEEVHQIGLDEVERIRGEMEAIIDRVGFPGSFDEFLTFLRTDERFYYDDPDELLEAYRAMAKRIDPLLPQLFGRIPRMPYGVKPIPESIAPDTTTAYYMRPSGDGTRPGWYYVNLHQPETRPKYEIPALSIHEAVPGHHFQIALAQELEGIPKFRRFGGPTAFVEGWGLYSESLGEEMGLYDDPYDKFGQLTYEMWRAVRLVVDTGIHHMGWTRQEAIDYFMDNAAKSENDIINEIDRYIAWPGQALAYKIGELRIQELRDRAEEALGDDFDIRDFHDTVLMNGAIPLDVLERVVDDWIEEQLDTD